jgi:hypothetical protein
MQMSRRQTWLVLAVALACPLGCANGPTSALLTVSANGPTPLLYLLGQVALGSQPPGTEQRVDGSVQLPGTLVVALPDVAEPVTISLHGLTTAGSPLVGAIALDAVPHQEVTGSVLLTSPGTPPVSTPSTVDLGGILAPGDGGAPGSDGGAGADLAPPTSAPDMPTTVLASDDFHRAAQVEWGTASDGHVWGADANTNAAFAIANNTGTIAPTQNGSQTAALGPAVADEDVVVTGALSAFVSNGKNNELAAMLRFVDDNRFYKAGMDGANFRFLARTSANNSVTLATTPFNATAGTSYSIRFRVVGSNLMAKVWPASAAEPSAWMLTATDASIASGQCGIRTIFNGTAIATLTSLLAVAP